MGIRCHGCRHHRTGLPNNMHSRPVPCSCTASSPDEDSKPVSIGWYAFSMTPEARVVAPDGIQALNSDFRSHASRKYCRCWKDSDLAG